VTCVSCGAEHPEGKKFCSECGTALSINCVGCGASLAGSEKFCSECGTPVGGARPAPSSPPVALTAERRLVSVLFADLVGFTTASEGRDAEDTRELLTRYFETSRQLIERYGGTVEKFIGDAVMAVWGTPVAKEDDAERAVRASLDLVAAVAALGQEAGAPELRARAGVLTGEAAVTIGAEGQGMVAGDMVNTASRIQSAAQPGTVLVGESTKRSSEASIAYDDAGEHELKGKAEPVQLWRALRVVAGARGLMRSAGLEAPFVGRDRELRLVKELFHASGEEKKAQLVSVTGIAGIGKSRLAWEFEKYIDGLAGDAFWHRGRCLSYGEGVAYWALAEMVRMRCGIFEDEEPTVAREKLRATLELHLSDDEERRWVEPRLAHLLGLEEGVAGDQENLFSAWRVLFERLAEESPTILVFEDLQWADAGLLDFLEYLLEWSRSHPLFVLALARPEFSDKRPTWGAGKRAFAQLYLEPLSAQSMRDLLTGFVPGLPDDLHERILERAEGVPLYAVETVRMLLDRGLVAREGNTYRPTGPVETLEVPETLHALVAARLDGLTPDERRLAQDGSVLGKTFTKQGLVAVTGLADGELEPLLASLLRKEILSVQADPRSPERGQYAFLQDIVKRVAYETLSKKERKAKHLASAEFLASVWGAEEDEIVEVVATHYLDAYDAAPDAPDAEEIRGKARNMFVRAGERAASLAANAEAQRSFDRAAELADDPLARAELLERAGVMAYSGARPHEAAARYESAIRLFDAEGADRASARVSARNAEIMWDRGRLEQGLESMDRAFQLLSQTEPDADLAALAAQIGRFMFFHGDNVLALERIETALDMAEALGLPEILANALNTKAVVLSSWGRSHEASTLVRAALEIALENDKPSAALRAYYNLADSLARRDRFEESVTAAREGLALARRVGNRYWERSFAGQTYEFYALGLWDEVIELSSQLPMEHWQEARLAFSGLPTVLVPTFVNRGHVDDAENLMTLLAELETSADVQERTAFFCGRSRLALEAGNPGDALALAVKTLDVGESLGVASETFKEAFVTGLEAALQLDDVGKAEELIGRIDALPPGRSPQSLQAHALRFRALLAARRGDVDEAERLFKRTTALYRELSMPFHLAVARLEQGEWLTGQSRADEAELAFAEARELFERLAATPWLERVDALAGVRT
jgi:class 3 adenylate cyclase/predicted ATPase